MWSDATWMCQECSNVVGSAAFPGRPGIVKYAHCRTCGGTTRQTSLAIPTACSRGSLWSGAGSITPSTSPPGMTGSTM